MNDTRSLPETGGVSTPQIPGIPSAEQAASSNTASIEKAWAEAKALSRDASPEELQQDAAMREHDRNQRFRHHFEYIAIVALWFAAFSIAVVGGIWIWHMAAPIRFRWLKGEDVSHLQSIMTAGLLVGVIGNHFKKRLS